MIDQPILDHMAHKIDFIFFVFLLKQKVPFVMHISILEAMCVRKSLQNNRQM